MVPGNRWGQVGCQVPDPRSEAPGCEWRWPCLQTCMGAQQRAVTHSPMPLMRGYRCVADAVRDAGLRSLGKQEYKQKTRTQQPFILTARRYVAAEAMSDPAFEAYRAVAAAPSLAEDLTAAGATLGTAEGLQLVPFASAGVKTILPPYTPPAG